MSFSKTRTSLGASLRSFRTSIVGPGVEGRRARSTIARGDGEPLRVRARRRASAPCSVARASSSRARASFCGSDGGSRATPTPDAGPARARSAVAGCIARALAPRLLDDDAPREDPARRHRRLAPDAATSRRCPRSEARSTDLERRRNELGQLLREAAQPSFDVRARLNTSRRVRPLVFSAAWPPALRDFRAAAALLGAIDRSRGPCCLGSSGSPSLRKLTTRTAPLRDFQ